MRSDKASQGASKRDIWAQSLDTVRGDADGESEIYGEFPRMTSRRRL